MNAAAPADVAIRHLGYAVVPAKPEMLKAVTFGLLDGFKADLA